MQTELSRAARLPPCPLPCLFPARVTHFFPAALFLSPSLSCSAAGLPAHLEGHQIPFSSARPPASPPAAGCGTAGKSPGLAAKPQSGRQAQGLLPWRDQTLPQSHPEGGKGGWAPASGVEGGQGAGGRVYKHSARGERLFIATTRRRPARIAGARGGEPRGRFVP